jgi:hypothetical protein
MIEAILLICAWTPSPQRTPSPEPNPSQDTTLESATDNKEKRTGEAEMLKKEGRKESDGKEGHNVGSDDNEQEEKKL